MGKSSGKQGSSGGLGAVAGAAASAGLGRESAGAEGLPREVAVDGVAAARVHAARVHAAARVGRRAAPAPLAHLERLVPHRLRRRRRRRRRQRHRPRPVHHAPHGDVVLLP